MKDKIILITGATSGIGKAAAIAIAKQGAHVVIHGRDAARTAAVQQEIIAACGHNRVDTLVADLLLLAVARALAAAFLEKYNRLDVLINNAGAIMSNNREVTSEGHERTLALNLLTPFLLTGLLMPALQKSTSARIINVSSNAHGQLAKPDFDDMQSERKYAPLPVYGNAKLFLILASQALVRRLQQQGIKNITVNTLHPGAISTNFGVQSDLGGLLNMIGKLLRPFMKTAEQGADTIVYLSTSTAVEGVTNTYFINRKAAPVSRRYNTIENEERTWIFCEQHTGITLF